MGTAMTISVSDRLINDVASMADVISPILTERRTIRDLRGLTTGVAEVWNDLLIRHGPRTFVMLAFTSSYLRAIGGHLYFCDQKGRRKSIQALRDFIRFAIRLYQEHLSGYDACEILSDDDVDDCVLLLGLFGHSTEPFGAKCEDTGSGLFGWILAVEMDVFLGEGSLLETAISSRKEIVQTILAASNCNELAVARQLEEHQKMVAKYHEWAAIFRRRRMVRHDLSSLSVRLIVFIDSASDFIAPLIEEKKTLAAFIVDAVECPGAGIGDENEFAGFESLLARFQPREFVQLALTHIFLKEICENYKIHSCYSDGDDFLSTPMPSGFLAYAARLYAKHGLGYRHAERDCLSVLECYDESREPFAGDKDESGTDLIGWLLAAQTDAYLEHPFVLNAALKVWRRIMQDMLPAEIFQKETALENRPNERGEIFKQFGADLRRARQKARRPFLSLEGMPDAAILFAKREIEANGSIGNTIASAKRGLLSILTRWLE